MPTSATKAKTAGPRDLLVISGHRAGEPQKTAEILEVLGTQGHRRYRVRWDDGHESIFFPGSDAVVQPARKTL